jgi:type III pantothenate kinase
MTSSPLIAVDIGNSRTKIGWDFGAAAAGQLPTPRETRSFPTGQLPPESLASALPQSLCRWHISSVHREGARILKDWIGAQRTNDVVRLLTNNDLPIVARVDHPERVGLDRLAAAVAANLQRDSGRPAIVVGAGSAITVNLVASDGAFEGGVILPGFRMSAEALYGADLLPLTVLAPNDDPPPIVGKNTEAAIQSGLFWGAVGAVREAVQRISDQLDQPPQIFVTGGDLRQLASYLGNSARFIPNLVLSGIAVAAARG